MAFVLNLLYRYFRRSISLSTLVFRLVKLTVQRSSFWRYITIIPGTWKVWVTRDHVISIYYHSLSAVPILSGQTTSIRLDTLMLFLMSNSYRWKLILAMTRVKFSVQNSCSIFSTRFHFRNDWQFWTPVSLHQATEKVRCWGAARRGICVWFHGDSSKTDRLGNQWLL